MIPSAGARRAVIHAVLHALLLVAVFALLAGPWLRSLWTAVPVDDAAEDAWLIVWVLDWVHHALATAPAGLLDPPINYPAPRQLTGSEHFLASQLLFAPLAWLTGSTIAAANLTTLLSYTLAAVFMDALLLRLGLGAGAAFLGGLIYGFGPTMSPARLHVLQGQHLFLPLAALLAHRLRDRPTVVRTMAFALALVAGVTSSFYMAVYVGFTTALWAAAELVRGVPGRVRFTVAAGVAGCIALAVLAAMAAPYLDRPEARGDLEFALSRYRTTHLEEGHLDNLTERVVPIGYLARGYLGCLIGGGYPVSCMPIDLLLPSWATLRQYLPAVLALTPVAVVFAAVHALRRRSRHRRIVIVGAALVFLGFLLAGPEYCRVAGVEVPLPRAFLAASPARFMRAPQRARVVSFFGGTLIVASGLHLMLSLVRPAVRPLLVPILAGLIVLRGAKEWPATEGFSLWESAALHGRLAPVDFLSNTAVTNPQPYRWVALATHRKPGPLLELPETRDGTTVVSQSLHRRPSVLFYTGYYPPHAQVVWRLIARLPDAAALDDLVDITGLRWLLLRPAAAWPDAMRRARFLAELRRHARVRGEVTIAGFTLVELDPTSKHPQWFESVAAGPRTGYSVLGTPLVPLSASPEQALIGLSARETLTAGLMAPLRVMMANRGTEAWAASLHPGTPLTVQLTVRWFGPDDDAREARTRAFELLRDVSPGETFVQDLMVGIPEQPGRYRVELTVHQLDGNALRSSQNPVSRVVNVVAGASKGPSGGG